MRQTLSIVVILALAFPASALTAPQHKAAEPARTEEDLGLGLLLDAPPEQVRARLGDPDVSRAEGKGAFWTYRLEHCALFLFFHEGPKGLHLTSASTGPRKRGEARVSVHACLASAVQLLE